MHSKTVYTQNGSAHQLAAALRRKLGQEVKIYTDDGNKITGTVLRVHPGYVTLIKAKVVHVNEKLRGEHSKRTVRVATCKITAFHR